jgi:hypothetical protein
MANSGAPARAGRCAGLMSKAGMPGGVYIFLPPIFLPLLFLYCKEQVTFTTLIRYQLFCPLTCLPWAEKWRANP